MLALINKNDKDNFENKQDFYDDVIFFWIFILERTYDIMQNETIKDKKI